MKRHRSSSGGDRQGQGGVVQDRVSAYSGGHQPALPLQGTHGGVGAGAMQHLRHGSWYSGQRDAAGAHPSGPGAQRVIEFASLPGSNLLHGQFNFGQSDCGGDLSSGGVLPHRRVSTSLGATSSRSWQMSLRGSGSEGGHLSSGWGVTEGLVPRRKVVRQAKRRRSFSGLLPEGIAQEVRASSTTRSQDTGVLCSPKRRGRRPGRGKAGHRHGSSLDHGRSSGGGSQGPGFQDDQGGSEIGNVMSNAITNFLGKGPTTRSQDKAEASSGGGRGSLPPQEVQHAVQRHNSGSFRIGSQALAGLEPPDHLTLLSSDSGKLDILDDVPTLDDLLSDMMTSEGARRNTAQERPAARSSRGGGPSPVSINNHGRTSSSGHPASVPSPRGSTKVLEGTGLTRSVSYDANATEPGDLNLSGFLQSPMLSSSGDPPASASGAITNRVGPQDPMAGMFADGPVLPGAPEGVLTGMPLPPSGWGHGVGPSVNQSAPPGYHSTPQAPVSMAGAPAVPLGQPGARAMTPQQVHQHKQRYIKLLHFRKQAQLLEQQLMQAMSRAGSIPEQQQYRNKLKTLHMAYKQRVAEMEHIKRLLLSQGQGLQGAPLARGPETEGLRGPSSGPPGGDPFGRAGSFEYGPPGGGTQGPMPRGMDPRGPMVQPGRGVMGPTEMVARYGAPLRPGMMVPQPGVDPTGAFSGEPRPGYLQGGQAGAMRSAGNPMWIPNNNPMGEGMSQPMAGNKLSMSPSRGPTDSPLQPGSMQAGRNMKGPGLLGPPRNPYSPMLPPESSGRYQELAMMPSGPSAMQGYGGGMGPSKTEEGLMTSSSYPASNRLPMSYSGVPVSLSSSPPPKEGSYTPTHPDLVMPSGVPSPLSPGMRSSMAMQDPLQRPTPGGSSSLPPNFSPSRLPAGWPASQPSAQYLSGGAPMLRQARGYEPNAPVHNPYVARGKYESPQVSLSPMQVASGQPINPGGISTLPPGQVVARGQVVATSPHASGSLPEGQRPMNMVGPGPRYYAASSPRLSTQPLPPASMAAGPAPTASEIQGTPSPLSRPIQGSAGMPSTSQSLVKLSPRLSSGVASSLPLSQPPLQGQGSMESHDYLSQLFSELPRETSSAFDADPLNPLELGLDPPAKVSLETGTDTILSSKVLAASPQEPLPAEVKAENLASDLTDMLVESVSNQETSLVASEPVDGGVPSTSCTSPKDPAMGDLAPSFLEDPAALPEEATPGGVQQEQEGAGASVPEPQNPTAGGRASPSPQVLVPEALVEEGPSTAHGSLGQVDTQPAVLESAPVLDGTSDGAQAVASSTPFRAGSQEALQGNDPPQQVQTSMPDSVLPNPVMADPMTNPLGMGGSSMGPRSRPQSAPLVSGEPGPPRSLQASSGTPLPGTPPTAPFSTGSPRGMTPNPLLPPRGPMTQAELIKFWFDQKLRSMGFHPEALSMQQRMFYFDKVKHEFYTNSESRSAARGGPLPLSSQPMASLPQAQSRGAWRGPESSAACGPGRPPPGAALPGTLAQSLPSGTQQLSPPGPRPSHLLPPATCALLPQAARGETLLSSAPTHPSTSRPEGGQPGMQALCPLPGFKPTDSSVPGSIFNDNPAASAEGQHRQARPLPLAHPGLGFPPASVAMSTQGAHDQVQVEGQRGVAPAVQQGPGNSLEGPSSQQEPRGMPISHQELRQLQDSFMRQLLADPVQVDQLRKIVAQVVMRENIHPQAAYKKVVEKIFIKKLRMHHPNVQISAGAPPGDRLPLSVSRPESQTAGEVRDGVDSAAGQSGVHSSPPLVGPASGQGMQGDGGSSSRSVPAGEVPGSSQDGGEPPHLSPLLTSPNMDEGAGAMETSTVAINSTDLASAPLSGGLNQPSDVPADARQVDGAATVEESSNMVTEDANDGGLPSPPQAECTNLPASNEVQLALETDVVS